MTTHSNKRPPAHPVALAIGKEAEKRFKAWLVKKRIPFTWNNEQKESGEIDFTIHLGNGKDIGVECEAKRFDLVTKYRSKGLDFLAAKCDKYAPDDWYVLDSVVGFYAQTMGNLLQYGERIKKRTQRGEIEEFIRIPETRLIFCTYYKPKLEKAA